MNIKIKYFFAVMVLLGCFYSCVKKKSFSQSPEIEYKSFSPYGMTDTADLVIGFSDGDGDIGKDKEDKTNNLFLTFYFFDTVTQVFHADYNSSLNDTIRIPYTIRKPIDDYNGKPISGEVAVKINGYRGSRKRKRIKYVLYMVDNAQHRSNILTTPELLVP